MQTQMDHRRFHLKSFLLGATICLFTLSAIQYVCVSDGMNMNSAVHDEMVPLSNRPKSREDRESSIESEQKQKQDSTNDNDNDYPTSKRHEEINSAWTSVTREATRTPQVAKGMPKSSFKNTHHHVQPGIHNMMNPSLHYINGKYLNGGKKFTPPDTVGITSFNDDRQNLVANHLPDFQPTSSMIAQTSQSLDFVVGGFAKTGTTFLTKWLNNESIYMMQGEQCQFAVCTAYSLGKELPDKKPLTLINTLIERRQSQQGKKMKSAFKCPNLIEDDVVDTLFSTYYPNTDFIIGLRHPVKWFESFYNFRVKKKKSPVPLANELIGSKCEYGTSWKVCTDRAKFALPLAKLGKTEMSADEVRLLADMVREDDEHATKKRKAVMKFFERQKKPSMGRVFVYDLDQLADDDESHLESFATELADFLHLDKPLTVPKREDRRNRARRVLKDEIEYEFDEYDEYDEDDDEYNEDDYEYSYEHENGQHDHLTSKSQGRSLKLKGKGEQYLHYNGEYDMKLWNAFDRLQIEKAEVLRRHELLRIDICDPLYDELRKVLVEEGRRTSEWLLNYFFQSDEVVMSQRERMEELIAGYSTDPCDK